jgi:rfaE bifunctional protein nucleotidyltransferase chain/domain
MLIQIFLKHCQMISRTVLVNGCFDPLHHGHISLLSYARSCGDRLIVAVNSDASLQRIKGPDRPRFSLNERIETLRSLRCVDDVVVIEDDTADAVIRSIKPSVVVKGSQYTEETTLEFRVISEIGCQLIFAPMVPAVSSTILMDRAVAAVKARVHLVTDLSLDRYISVAPGGISAEYATTTYQNSMVNERAGGGGNLALSISRLSALKSLVACIGNSDDDLRIKDILRANMINTGSLIQVNSAYCGVYGKVMSEVDGGVTRELLRLDTVPSRPPASQSRLQDALCGLLPAVERNDVVVISRYETPDRSGWIDSLIDQFAMLVKRQGGKVICACRHRVGSFSSADVLVLNESELSQLLPPSVRAAQSVVDRISYAGERLCNHSIVVTLGSRGAALWEKSRRTVDLLSTSVCPPGTDPTGAGDVFLAVFSAMISAGSDTQHATRCAVAEATRSLFAMARPAVVFSSAIFRGATHGGFRAAS